MTTIPNKISMQDILDNLDKGINVTSGCNLTASAMKLITECKLKVIHQDDIDGTSYSIVDASKLKDKYDTLSETRLYRGKPVHFVKRMKHIVMCSLGDMTMTMPLTDWLNLQLMNRRGRRPRISGHATVFNRRRR